jgi:Flp pilus assembly protein TadD
VVEVLRGRALANAALGKYAAAAEDYTRALALRPKDVSLRTARGWAYLASDAAKLALDDFVAVIRVAPKDGDAHNGRGYALARLGRHADAVGDAHTALKLGPKNARMLYNTARIFAQAAGGQDARTALELGPKNTRMLSNTARIFALAAGGQDARGAHRDEALSCLAGALSLLRDDAERAKFWREVIRPDSALDPIRHSYGYAQLAAQYPKPAK